MQEIKHRIVCLKFIKFILKSTFIFKKKANCYMYDVRDGLIEIISYPEGSDKHVTPEQLEKLIKLELVFLDKAYGEYQDQSQWCFCDEDEDEIDEIIGL